MRVSLIGGSWNGGNGSVAYAVPMAVSGGSKLLIFVRPKASDITFATESLRLNLYITIVGISARQKARTPANV
jgi:hypothetical protein